MFCRVRPALQEEVGIFHERRNSAGFISTKAGSKKKLDSKLNIDFPDKSTEAKKITLKYSGDQVCVSGCVQGFIQDLRLGGGNLGLYETVLIF